MAAVARYALALLCVAVALAVTLLLEPDGLFTPLFFFAIILSAWFGGLGPGLLAALLSTLCISYFFLAPLYTLKFDLSHLPHLTVFFISAVLVSSWSVVRKRAETLLRQARDEQEAKVQERTADLKQANEQLQAEIAERGRVEEVLRQRAAELAHVARVTTMGELTSSIAHEVNQPLAAIVTNGNACLRWLGNNPPNVEEAKQSVTRIVKDGHRASEVVGRVRAFFKKATPEKVSVNINSLIEDVISMVQGELQRNRVQVQTELAGDLPPVISDPIQLQQVLLNLIINAIEAMADVNGRRELVIKSEAYDPETVLVAVQDTGPGIDQQNAAQLFNAFFTTKPSGLGMGLSISRTTIEAYGGRLWATAAEGGGATFQFTLPTTDGSV